MLNSYFTVGRLKLTRVCWIYPKWTKISELKWTNDFFRLAYHLFLLIFCLFYTFLSCFYASVFNCWSCFAPDSITAVGGGEIQNMEANTAPPVFSEPYHSASPMQQNVPALFLLSSLAFFSRTVLHHLLASSLNSFRQNLQKYPGYFITRSR